MNLNETKKYLVTRREEPDVDRWEVTVHYEHSHALNFSISRVPSEATCSLIMTGSVKWDSCSNWHDDGCLHFCYPEEMIELAKVVKICYILTEELLPTWGGYVPPEPPAQLYLGAY